ncbi:hypothetical protein OHC33_010860 [Knufia fluminis]|uniref:Serine aminopeptidase S33 domain-containing protein n=1 Tax=Knufia fluminis TaxID=191047 RepID=A0AAN8IHK3_9EURO|nr:hypothetical protein OHC33_010860 [Knufia fluminis]
MAFPADGTFTTRDGTKLYTKTWPAQAAPNVHLIFIHGFSDHINAYYDLFPTLSSPPYNITVHGFDQRGWGRSVSADKSLRGQTGDTHQVLCDIHDFICHVSDSIRSTTTAGNPKLFLMGHSMGGAESLMYLLSDPNTFTLSSLDAKKNPDAGVPLPIQGLLVEAPHVGFPPASQPNSLVVVAGRLAGKLLPNRQMVQKLDSSYMCRDPKVCKDWEDDELCHDTGTLRGLSGLLDRAGYLSGYGAGTTKVQAAMRETLPCPVWFGHGTGDKVCDFDAGKRLYNRLVENRKGDAMAEQSRFVSYEGGYHKLHAEPDGMGEQFVKDVGNWISGIAGGSAGSKI